MREQVRHPHRIVPSHHLSGCYPLSIRFRLASTYFDSSSPLRFTSRLLILECLPHTQKSPKFSPPTCYQGSGLGFITTTGSSATPSASIGLVSPLAPLLPVPSHRTQGASPGKSTCLVLNPSVLTYKVIQLLGFPTVCKVTHFVSQPRFASAMFQDTPSASSRPHCCQ